jgi:hypothetical protein
MTHRVFQKKKVHTDLFKIAEDFFDSNPISKARTTNLRHCCIEKLYWFCTSFSVLNLVVTVGLVCHLIIDHSTQNIEGVVGDQVDKQYSINSIESLPRTYIFICVPHIQI